MWEAQESEKSTNTVLSGGSVLRMQPRLILWRLSETTQQNSKVREGAGKGRRGKKEEEEKGGDKGRERKEGKGRGEE